MNLKNCFKNFTILTLVLFLSVGFTSAQTNKLPVPRQEKLLNGLKVLTFSEPNTEKVTLKLRIHSGSAFDRQDKEGTMALLGDILFPNEEAKDFFREDLGGSLEVESTYDYIQITATSNSDQFLTMLETVANAVSNPQIDKETTGKVVSARIEKVKELEKSPSYVADLTVSKRLFGDFPYGRAQTGTSESLQKIDFADLIFARDRFLTPDNATLTVVGNIKSDLVNRAVRRYFGAWEKSDKKVPATFAQPNTPDTKLLIFNSPNVENSEIRYGFRGLARNDKDFSSLLVWSKILQARLLESVPENHQKDTSAFLNSNLLSGLIIIKFSDMKVNPQSDKMIQDADEFQKMIFEILFNNKFSAEELEKAKTEVKAEISRKSVSDFWLDADTFKFVSVKDEIQKANSVTIADVQKITQRLVKEPIVAVMLVNSKEKEK